MGRIQIALAIATAAASGSAATAVAINMLAEPPAQTACSMPVPIAACPVPQASQVAPQFFTGRQLPTSGGAPLVFKP